jgi:hypothetical protein
MRNHSAQIAINPAACSAFSKQKLDLLSFCALVQHQMIDRLDPGQ